MGGRIIPKCRSFASSQNWRQTSIGRSLRFGDVLRSVSPFVSLARDPIVLVFLANADTIGVDVISTKVQTVDTPLSLMNYGVRQLMGRRIVPAVQE